MTNIYNLQSQGNLSENLTLQIGINEVLVKNINASNELKGEISKLYGPYGQNRMIIQKSKKILITSDSSVILNNLNSIHPACKIIASSVFFQDQELGDSSGFLIILTGEILNQALKLLIEGFHTYEISRAFQRAEDVCLKILNTLSNYKLKSLKNLKNIILILSGSLDSNCQGLTSHIIPQVALACIKIMSRKKEKFSQEKIRVVKILGGPWCNTKTITGVIIPKDSEGTIKIVKKAKILILNCPLDFFCLETKNNVQFRNPKEILSFEFKEKMLMQEKIQALFTIGVNVIVAPSFNEEVIQILNEKDVLALKTQSKFEMHRIAELTNSNVLSKFTSPQISDVGSCERVSVRAFGTQKITIFHQDFNQSCIFSIIARATCNSILDSIERLIYKASSIFKTITRDNRFIPGGGASEIELTRRLKKFSESTLTSTDAFLIKRFAGCFEIFPEILIENSNLKDLNLISILQEKHKNGGDTIGFDLKTLAIKCSKKSGVWDIFSCKFWAVKNSIDCALTILSIDQIIIAREAIRN